jgi:hypothetical protein
MRPPTSPEWSLVGFTDPLLRGNPKLAEYTRQWLLGYQAGHAGAIDTITVNVLGEPGTPPKIEIWVQVLRKGGHIEEIVNGVQDMIKSEAREAGVVLVPRSLINKFSKPLDFLITKC